MTLADSTLPKTATPEQTRESSRRRMARLLRLTPLAWVVAVYEHGNIQRAEMQQLRATLRDLPIEEVVVAERKLAGAVAIIDELLARNTPAIVSFVSPGDLLVEFCLNLDLGRERLINRPVRLIVWVTPYEHAKLQQLAPNFYSRVGAVLHFPGIPDSLYAAPDDQHPSVGSGGDSRIRRRRPIDDPGDPQRRRRLYDYLRRRLQVLQTPLVPDWQALAETWYDMAGLYETERPADWQEAISAYTQAAVAFSHTMPDRLYHDALLQAARVAHAGGRYKQAIHFLDELIAAAEAPAELTATLVGEKGLNQLALGNFAEALPLLERALQTDQDRLGPDHPDTATSLNGLAELLRAQGDYGAARPLYERALRIREAQLGPDHPATATSLNNLAYLLRAQGDTGAARPLYERALRIHEAQLGPDHPDTALSLNNLAGLLDAQGDYGAARPLYERALRIREAQLGPDHPDTAISLNNLAGLLEAQGDTGAARPLYERAVTILERVLGPNHPNTKIVRGNLDGLIRQQAAAANPPTAQSPDTLRAFLRRLLDQLGNTEDDDQTTAPP